MTGIAKRTVVSCRRLGNTYVLLTTDLDQVHAWGGREEMLRAAVPCLALDIADATGSARLTSPPTAGQYPWFVEDIQQGDWYIDRARATEFCASVAQDECLGDVEGIASSADRGTAQA